MEEIKNTVYQVMRGWDVKKSGSQDNPDFWLRQILSKKERAHVQCSYFKNGVLGLKVDSSTWLYYFSTQKECLLDNLRKKFKSVKDVRFRIGELSEQEKNKISKARRRA
ncbi:MAG: DciA family protein [Candidatus Omnitrophota bacterium]